MHQKPFNVLESVPLLPVYTQSGSKASSLAVAFVSLKVPSSFHKAPRAERRELYVAYPFPYSCI